MGSLANVERHTNLFIVFASSYCSEHFHFSNRQFLIGYALRQLCSHLWPNPRHATAYGADDREKGTKQLEWHSLFRGAYGRVARRLDVHPSYVSRVARGKPRSAKIEQALKEEIARIEKRRPK